MWGISSDSKAIRVLFDCQEESCKSFLRSKVSEWLLLLLYPPMFTVVTFSRIHSKSSDSVSNSIFAPIRFFRSSSSHLPILLSFLCYFNLLLTSSLVC